MWRDLILIMSNQMCTRDDFCFSCIIFSNKMSWFL
ncbi:Protein of unknown function [Gryllus bimaculatus]|nr:Protein of unknown function [Gryllus bimaculatus]